MRGIFEKIPLHPKNFRGMGVVWVYRAIHIGLVIQRRGCVPDEESTKI